MSTTGMRATRFQPTLPARGATGAPLHEEEIWQAFQPTLPARGATCCQSPANSYNAHFNPRSPHGERLVPLWFLTSVTDFNPRSPHGERRQRFFRTPQRLEFQPTLPARGATLSGGHRAGHVGISTHAPRTGSDIKTFSNQAGFPAISTHAPRTGSDKRGKYITIGVHRFQPTLPARGATRKPRRPFAFPRHISTHAPRTGSDSNTTIGYVWYGSFQPTLPARGAT